MLLLLKMADQDNYCYFDSVYQYKVMVFVVEIDSHNSYVMGVVVVVGLHKNLYHLLDRDRL